MARGEVELIASDSVDWLGAPLLVRDETIGVAAIQTYDRAVRLGPEDRDLFVFVCGQIAAAIKARRDEDALRASEVRLRQVIDLVPHFIFARDEEGRYRLANRATAEAYGTTVEALIGRTDAELGRPAEEARPLARGRPRGDRERHAQGDRRGVDHRRGRPRALPADHQDPVRLLRQRAARACSASRSTSRSGGRRRRRCGARRRRRA